MILDRDGLTKGKACCKEKKGGGLFKIYFAMMKKVAKFKTKKKIFCLKNVMISKNRSSLLINVQNLYFCPQNILISEKKMLIAFNRIHDSCFSPKLRCGQRARVQLPEAGRQGGYHHDVIIKK